MTSICAIKQLAAKTESREVKIFVSKTDIIVKKTLLSLLNILQIKLFKLLYKLHT